MPPAAAIGPGVERLDRLVDRHAGLGVAGEDRALDGRGAAPARQQRRVDVQPQRAREQPRRDVEAVRADDDRVDRRPAARAARAGWTGMPSRCATLLRRRRGEPAAAAARRVRAREQPSDVVRLGEPLEHVGAERRRRGDGDAHQRRTIAGPQRRERLLAVLVVGAVDDQHAVQVVELVLHDAGAVALRARSGRRRRSASLPSSVDLDRPLDRDADALSERQPSSSVSVSSERSTITRVHDRARPLVVGLEHEQALEHADLRRGEPDALGVVHQRGSSARRAGAGRRRTR